MEQPLKQAELHMLDFVIRTGIGSDQHPDKRYLWTDAFAVFNFLSLYRATGDESHLRHALRLVDLVHHTLGKHRADDDRTGWISGLTEEEGPAHPTVGGLRIGKPITERQPDDPFDMHLEWERDGQYFHYITKWMHALNCVTRVTGDTRYRQWAVELGKAAADGFIKDSTNPRMCWKMSIDLSRVLVPTMGQLDPIDGYTTYAQVIADQRDAEQDHGYQRCRSAIKEMKQMCASMSWFSDDDLGIGGLLTAITELTHLISMAAVPQDRIIEQALEDAVGSLDRYERFNPLTKSADARLAFRELGLAIGLQAIPHAAEVVSTKPQHFQDHTTLKHHLDAILRHDELADRILRFWTDPGNQAADTWTGHHDINEVMLATALIGPGHLIDSPDQTYKPANAATGPSARRQQ